MIDVLREIENISDKGIIDTLSPVIYHGAADVQTAYDEMIKTVLNNSFKFKQQNFIVYRYNRSEHVKFVNSLATFSKLIKDKKFEGLKSKIVELWKITRFFHQYKEFSLERIFPKNKDKEQE